MPHDASPPPCPAWRRLLGLGSFLFLMAGLAAPAWSADMTITARYLGESDTDFENTTPPSGFCADLPEFCGNHETIGVPITYTKSTIRGASNVRDKFYIRMPAAQKVTVTSQRGDTYDLTMMFTVISQNVTVESGGGVPVYTYNPGGGCSYLSDEIVDGPDYPGMRYAWTIKNPNNPQECYSDSDYGNNGDRRRSYVDELTIGYRLLLPRPFNMRQGLYRGSVSYRVGPGGDIDLGDGVSGLNTNTLTIHFEVDVQHAMDVRFPPGSDHAVLEPPGGWQAWLAGRGSPPLLQRDLPFHLWSTGPLSLFTRCQYERAGQCWIRNGNGDEVPVEVAISMPPAVHINHRPVHRVPIPPESGTPLQLDQSMPIDNQRGQVHFRVDGQGVSAMTKQPGTTYTGQVGVVFDAGL
ncbi:hypothetical protein ACI2KE_20060 [Pseudomonas monteilii]